MRGAGSSAALVSFVLVFAAGQPMVTAEPAPGQETAASAKRPAAVAAPPPMQPRQAKPAPIKVRAAPNIVAEKRVATPKVKPPQAKPPHPKPAVPLEAVARNTAPRANAAPVFSAAEGQRFPEPSPGALRRGVRRDEVIVPLPPSDVQAQAPVGPPAPPPPLAAPQGPLLTVRMQPPGLPAAMQPAPSTEHAPLPANEPPQVRATAAPGALNMVRSAQEQIAQVPGQLMWIRDGLMAARDGIDGALVFFGDDGHVLGRAKFPTGFEPEDIVGLPDAIRLIDISHRTQITIRRNLNPAKTFDLAITPNVSDATVRAQRLTRRGPQELIVNDERQNGTHPLTVRSVAGGHLAQAHEISTGSGDNRYVVSEEITAVKPALQVRVFVQRFDRDGRLSGVAHVPLDGFEAVPRNFIAVTGQGLVRVLAPMANRIVVREFEFSAPPRGRAGVEQLKNLGRAVRDIPIDSEITGGSHLPFRSNAPNVEVTVATPPIARVSVMENARAYLTVNWVMKADNFSRPSIPNSCAPGQGSIWLRPRHFTADMIGTTIGPMPYRWGGDDTPNSYRLRIEWGALAGDLCTCRDAAFNYCVFPEAVGIDCSGFVSRAWGIAKRGTSGLLDVATDVDTIEALKPGDAFDWPQRHVRLFAGMAEGAAIAFNVIEASTRFECEAVCERTLRPSELDGYRLIRYKGITENGAVASSTQNGGAAPDGAKPNGSKPNGSKPNGTTATPLGENGSSEPNGGVAPASATNEATAVEIKRRGATRTTKRTVRHAATTREQRR